MLTSQQSLMTDYMSHNVIRLKKMNFVKKKSLNPIKALGKILKSKNKVDRLIALDILKSCKEEDLSLLQTVNNRDSPYGRDGSTLTRRN